MSVALIFFLVPPPVGGPVLILLEHDPLYDAGSPSLTVPSGADRVRTQTIPEDMSVNPGYKGHYLIYLQLCKYLVLVNISAPLVAICRSHNNKYVLASNIQCVSDCTSFAPLGTISRSRNNKYVPASNIHCVSDYILLLLI